jgi:hypothetical protein
MAEITGKDYETLGGRVPKKLADFSGLSPLRCCPFFSPFSTPP